MLKSMTGFGRGEYRGPDRLYQATAQSVNHRFLEVRTRLPKRLAHLEHRIHKTIRERFSRGHFDLSVEVRDLAEHPRALRVNRALATAYLRALSDLQKEFELAGDVTLEMVARCEGILESEETETEEAATLEEEWAAISQACEAALTALTGMREKEGEALAQALQTHLERVESHLSLITRRAVLIPALYQERVQGRLQALLTEAVTLDPGRLEQEVAFLADRADVSEEIARLDSHLAQFRTTLQAPGPHGRTLDFLLQEMHREVTTVGAKASDTVMAQEGIALKTELERIREQVQNVE